MLANILIRNDQSRLSSAGASAVYTPTEQRIIDVLADGEAHPRSELMACIEDEMALPSALALHLVNIRKKLRPLGQTVLCLNNGKVRPTAYQQVRKISVK